jgi:hypothetical protein
MIAGLNLHLFLSEHMHLLQNALIDPVPGFAVRQTGDDRIIDGYAGGTQAKGLDMGGKGEDGHGNPFFP